MSRVYFVLDSLHGDYASVLSALDTASAAKYSFTPIQVIRSASHDANIKIVPANITEAERTGSLAPLARASYGTGVYRDELTDQGDKTLRAFGLLGERGRNVEYIRNEQGGSPTASNYGAGDGKTYADAYNGPQDPAINGGTDETHLEGTTYYYCGEIYGVWDSFGAEGKFGKGRIDIEKAGGTGAANAIILRGDQPHDPGLMYLDVRGRDDGQQLPWTEYSTGVYVQGDFNVTDDLLEFGAPAYAVVTGYGATLSTTDLVQRAILEKGASLSAIEGGANVEKYWIMNSGNAVAQAIGQVWQYDDSGTSYVDETTDANNATVLDWSFFPASPAAGDIIYIGFASEFSGAQIDVGTAGVGTYTIQWQYWNGSTWAALTDVQDDTDNLKTAGSNLLAFNPKSDWAATVVNASASLFYIRGVLQSGTMTTAPVGDQGWIKQSAIFVHLYDSGDPTGKRVLTVGAGRYWSFNSEATRCGHLEFINMSALEPGSVASALSPNNSLPGLTGDLPLTLKIKGGRYFWSAASYFQFGGMTELTFEASTDGNILFDTSDRPAKTHEGFQALITPLDASITASDPTKFDDIPRWVQFDRQTNGLYFNSSGSAFTGSRPDSCTVSGYICTNSGTIEKGLDNQTGQADMHGLACRGDKPATQWNWDRVYIYKAGSAINIYQSATGSGQGPVNGAALDFKNFSLTDFVVDTNNKAPSNSAGQNGLVPNGDNDMLLYDDGSGDHSNVIFRRGVFMDIVPAAGTFEGLYTSPTVTHSGGAIAMNWSESHTIEDMQILRCAHGFRGDRAGHIEALHVVQEDNSLSSFVDVTNSFIDDGSPASAKMFVATPAANDAVYIGRKQDSFRAPSIRGTVAAVGGPTLAFEYWNGSSWAAVSNLSDGTSGLTTTSEQHITFDRPSDWATTTIDSKDYYWFRIRLVSGSFSTEPEADLIRGPDTGYNFKARRIYLEDIEHYWLATRSGTYGGGTHTIDIDEFKGKLLSGETIAAKKMFRFGSSGGSEETLSQFKARTKSRTTTDAWAAGVFLPNVSETPGVDITEVA